MEIAMVATVIAILALLVLPLYRKRVQEARITSAQDEVASIAKAQLLAEADLGFPVRLQDLDNSEEIGGVPLDGSNVDVYPPIAAWNGTLEAVVPVARSTVVSNWRGPYASLNNFAFVDDLADYWYSVSDGNGFIYVVDNTPSGPAYPNGNIVDNTAEDRYPLDPWGTPYAFFGPSRFPLDNPDSNESTFNFSIVVSFGPDGSVGTGNPTIQINPNLYRRYNPADISAGGLIGDDQSPDTNDIIYRF